MRGERVMTSQRNLKLKANSYSIPVLLAVTATLFATPTFQFLGDLAGGSVYSIAKGVSAKGEFVVGESSSTASGIMDPLRFGNNTEAFLWKLSNNSMIGLGDLSGGAF